MKRDPEGSNTVEEFVEGFDGEKFFVDVFNAMVNADVGVRS